MDKNISKKIAAELGIKAWQAEAAEQLIDEGNTVPFIARYRKEATGAMDDEMLRAFDERLRYLRNLEERRETILASIEEQGKLDEELREKIIAAETAAALEDLYRPYRPKRKTRADIAREKGLQGLADFLLSGDPGDPIREAEKYLSEEKEVPDAETAMRLAQDIIAGDVSDNADFRGWIRNRTAKAGDIVCSPGPKGREAIEDSYKRLIAPSIETDIRGSLTEAAEEGAMKVFASNLEQLLMQPPLRGMTVLGWDPAFRTGCKLAVCDPTGKILDTAVIYPTPPQNRVGEAVRVLTALCDKYGVDVISVGNGTASRESEKIIADFIRGYGSGRRGKSLSYVIVNEAGASVYSASKLATEEYPDLDVGERSSASIARRLQDPLSELVKIDPKAIGVGQYQHDMNQKRLGEVLDAVVEDCVNRVGVDVNTASASLLGYVSGISRQIASNIVAYREENGSFGSRKQLLKVPKLGPKAFEQCAGFLRITGGSEPLDATAVHPESYDAAKKILAAAGYRTSDITGSGIQIKGLKPGFADELGIGKYTFDDICSELAKPGRDPRDEVPAPVLRSDVMEMSDLKPDMELTGTVRNIVDFGAFVDIGVHQDGLVHISQLSDRFVKHPLDVVKVGDVVKVHVISVDEKRGKIALSMKQK